LVVVVAVIGLGFAKLTYKPIPCSLISNCVKAVLEVNSGEKIIDDSYISLTLQILLQKLGNYNACKWLLTSLKRRGMCFDKGFSTAKAERKMDM
jgi:hypothetical protein